MFKRVYAKLDALCHAHPKTMAYGMLVFATTCFVLNPAIRQHPAFVAGTIVVALLPWVALELSAWARKRRNLRRGEPLPH